MRLDRQEQIQKEVDEQLRKIDDMMRRGNISRNNYLYRRARILARLGGKNRIKLVSSPQLKNSLGLAHERAGPWVRIVPGGLPESGKR